MVQVDERMRLFVAAFLISFVVATHCLNLHRTFSRVRRYGGSITSVKMASTEEETQKISPRDERRRILKSSNYNR